MPVFRVDKSRDFTGVANCGFKDRSLSAKAKGILVEMLSLPESWDYTLKGLTTLFSDGIDSIRQGINELEKYLEHRKNVKTQKANKVRASPVVPHGKQTVKQLIGQNQGVSTVESNDPDIKAFDRIARKYGVDYAVKKVKTIDKPKYVIFFKARDSDALKQALTEYADKVTTQKERKPSVLQKLRDYVAVVQNRVLERSKDKQKGQER